MVHTDSHALPSQTRGSQDGRTVGAVIAIRARGKTTYVPRMQSSRSARFTVTAQDVTWFLLPYHERSPTEYDAGDPVTYPSDAK